METVLITGASGFIGNLIFTECKKKFSIVTLGRTVVRESDRHVIYDFLENRIITLPMVDCVIHCASMVHKVPRSMREASAFFGVNVDGTKRLLNALEAGTQIKKFVFISSVAVYGLVTGIGISEDAPLLATDPYGKSKIEAEQLISQWCIQRDIEYYIFRLPLVAGKNAPGNLGTMVKGIKSGKYLSIGNGSAKKSMILATDLAKLSASVQGKRGIYNLTDGYHPSFRELEFKISAFYKKKNPVSLPIWIAKMLGFAGDIIGSKFPVDSNKLKKITSTLTFDDTRARTQLGWNPSEVLIDWEIE